MVTSYGPVVLTLVETSPTFVHCNNATNDVLHPYNFIFFDSSSVHSPSSRYCIREGLSFLNCDTAILEVNLLHPGDRDKIGIPRTFTVPVATGRTGLTHLRLLPSPGVCKPSLWLASRHHTKNSSSNRLGRTTGEEYSRFAPAKSQVKSDSKQSQPVPDTILCTSLLTLQSLRAHETILSSRISALQRIFTTTTMASGTSETITNGTSSPEQVFFL